MIQAGSKKCAKVHASSDLISLFLFRLSPNSPVFELYEYYDTEDIPNVAMTSKREHINMCLLFFASCHTIVLQQIAVRLRWTNNACSKAKTYALPLHTAELPLKIDKMSPLVSSCTTVQCWQMTPSLGSGSGLNCTLVCHWMMCSWGRGRDVEHVMKSLANHINCWFNYWQLLFYMFRRPQARLWSLLILWAPFGIFLCKFGQFLQTVMSGSAEKFTVLSVLEVSVLL